jgi:transcription elongation factor SPT6
VRTQITVNPTKMGLVEIDENHPLYGTKYLLNKPVNTLQKDEFLKMVQAEKNNLLTISISPDEQQDKDDETRAIAPTLFEDIWSMHYYMSTDVSDVAQAWNERRRAALQQALHDILYPMFARELRDRLLAEARQGATRICCEKIYNWLKVAPYPLPAAAQNEAVMPGERHHGASAPIGCRVLGITYSSER